MILSENALYLHGLKDAIAGSSSCGKIIYDYEKVVAIFVKQDVIALFKSSLFILCYFYLKLIFINNKQ